ncbi:uncharacterized protein BDV17DRAFT_253212 [Aspergillus undulatus]|uniref:uncharacterized protein n=1 Tax=Aspergillus undulatus TaxID=1810928 RepID=UPI003CCE505E
MSAMTPEVDRIYVFPRSPGVSPIWRARRNRWSLLPCYVALLLGHFSRPGSIQSQFRKFPAHSVPQLVDQPVHRVVDEMLFHSHESVHAKSKGAVKMRQDINSATENVQRNKLRIQRPEIRNTNYSA